MKNTMKTTAFFASMIFGTSLYAAPPIDGLYSSFFGGFAYVPGDYYLDMNNFLNLKINDVTYQAGFDGGGNIGYKSNHLRYEGEISYIKANAENMKVNSISQTSVGGYTQGEFALANIYYDFSNFSSTLQPFLGVGIGYGWIQDKLDSNGPSGLTHFSVNGSAFAYQGNIGVTFNFAENYALSLGYRYLTTLNVFDFGESFQAHVANLGVTYRFDGNNYK